MVRVECYSGYKADERPLRFSIDGREFAVERILDRWTSPECDGFRVATSGGVYILERNRAAGSWEARPWKRTS